ncbi:hypothetical protein E4U34_000438, partial [Claviceps purpurea]
LVTPTQPSISLLHSARDVILTRLYYFRRSDHTACRHAVQPVDEDNLSQDLSQLRVGSTTSEARSSASLKFPTTVCRYGTVNDDSDRCSMTTIDSEPRWMRCDAKF